MNLRPLAPHASALPGCAILRLNICMGPRQPITKESIQQMLDDNAPPFATPQQRLAWERGYLTGLLIRLSNEDILVHRAIRERLQD